MDLPKGFFLGSTLFRRKIRTTLTGVWIRQPENDHGTRIVALGFKQAALRGYLNASKYKINAGLGLLGSLLEGIERCAVGRCQRRRSPLVAGSVGRYTSTSNLVPVSLDCG